MLIPLLASRSYWQHLIGLSGDQVCLEANTAIAHFATGKSDAAVGADDYEWVKKAADVYDFHH